MRKIFLPLLLFLIAQVISNAQSFIGSFEFEGHTRNYEVYLPQNFHAKMPVVFVLHGYTGSILGIKEMSNMHEVADSSGFITVYPKSASVSWNTGETEPPYGWGMYDTTINDVAFISALLDTIDKHFNISLSQIYVCGYSSGGEMTFRLATELGHRFAAAASISGSLNEKIGSAEPIRPFPIIHMHGTSDQFISYISPYYNLWSVEKTLNFWIDNNKCTSQADTIRLPDIDQTDGCTIDKISYTNCSGNAKVIHYKVNGGAHGWPGSSVGNSDVHNINNDINASIEILNFFKNYENPLVNLAYCNNINLFPTYISFDEHSLNLLAQLYNPENHPVKVLAYIEAENSDYKDSLELQISNDSLDNFYQGNKLLSDLNNDFYKVSIKTTDLDENISTISPFYRYFTNIGQLVVSDTIIFGYYDEWSYLQQFKLTLRNTDTIAISDVTVRISTEDPRINKIGNSNLEFYDIPANGNSTSKQNFSFSFVNDSIKLAIDKENPIKIILDIYSKNRLLWIDTLDFYYTNLVGIEKSDIIINTFNLYQNYPNPFNPTTSIKYSIANRQFVTLKIFNLLGQEIDTFVNEEKPAGTYELTWNAANLPSGVYFYQLRTMPIGRQAGGFIATKKMVLLR